MLDKFCKEEFTQKSFLYCNLFCYPKLTAINEFIINIWSFIILRYFWKNIIIERKKIRVKIVQLNVQQIFVLCCRWKLKIKRKNPLFPKYITLQLNGFDFLLISKKNRYKTVDKLKIAFYKLCPFPNNKYIRLYTSWSQ